LSILVEQKDLINAQQMEVAVNGPDGATHLIICTGLVELGCIRRGIYTFVVGPQISRRQFVGAIASGALSALQGFDKEPEEEDPEVEPGAGLILIDANYDDACGQVRVRTEISSSNVMTKLAISYNVSILAELPPF
jgi:hypothetical protein